MSNIDEAEFSRMVEDIRNERESIIKHNPIGTDEEVLLWMLLGCLASYLSLNELETPCFNGKPGAGTYREAVLFVLRGRMEPIFDADRYLDALTEESGGRATLSLG
ncbi:MAG TPA: hypothetical protein VNA17_10105 [Pyrinomonadaceae bacterium]|nr:hypothetical protein [Pyrinomonadaceae bacterium]